VLFDPDTGETRAMRSKEDAQDYRYFPDPDLPPLVIAPHWVERVRAAMPELPAAMAARFERDDGLSAYDAAMMTQSLPFARYYEAVHATRLRPAQAGGQLADGRGVPKRLNAEGRDIDAAPVAPAALATLIGRVVDGTVSQQRRAPGVRRAVGSGEGADPDAVDRRQGLKQMNDSGALEAIVDEVIAANARSRSRSSAPARTRPSTRWSAR
jgi:aspartyl-tRNA(Asn)/glutamyl-tRNA(Gln) amidotransferase subunit B